MTDVTYCTCGHQEKYHHYHYGSSSHTGWCSWISCECDRYTTAENLKIIELLEQRRAIPFVIALGFTFAKIFIRNYIFSPLVWIWDRFAPGVIIIGIIGVIFVIGCSASFLITLDAQNTAKNVTVHCYTGDKTLYEGVVKEIYMNDGGVHIITSTGNEYYCNGFEYNKEKK